MGILSLSSNIASLEAQRRLGQATSALGSSFTRLSSGLRINSASDDASGLSIGSSLRNDSRVFSQGVRNVNDALSLSSIAEGAASSLSTVLTRITELAEQSSNGTLSGTQRKALDGEAQALRKEYNRIVQVTNFNGLQLLTGNTTVGVQAGYDRVNLVLSNLQTTFVNDGTFNAGQTLQTGTTTAQTSAYDVNNDGNLDLVGTTVGDDKLSVFLGNGDGTFRARISFDAPIDAFTFTMADYNGDSILDFAGQTNVTGEVGVLFGNGNGTFRSIVTYAGFSSNGDVVGGSVDFNNDGHPDIVTDSFTATGIGILINNGNGTFRAPISFVAGNGNGGLNFQDINGDGNADIVNAAYNDGQIDVLIGNGNGTFRARQVYNLGTNAQVVSLADVNGDGVSDAVSFNDTTHVSLVLFGNSNGSFRAGVNFSTPEGSTNATPMDFDKDGNVDIVSGNGTSFDVLYGNGDGTFRSSVSYTGAGPADTSDFDGNTSFDYTANGANTISLFFGNGSYASYLGGFSLKTKAESLHALDDMKRSLRNLSSSIGIIGSSQSRLNVMASGLTQSRENYDAAASRIFDVDVAEESSSLLRAQILQQGAAAILGQANQLPALALQLLR